MNKRLFPLLLVALTGCASSGNPTTQAASTQAAAASNPSQSPNSSSTTNSSNPNSCPPKPTGSLSAQDLKPLNLGTEAIKESGQVSDQRSVGYTFEAKVGQRFNFAQSSSKACVYLYSPENKLMPDNEIPKDGKYTVQVSSPQGNTQYTLEMGLDSLLSATPSNQTSAGKLSKDQAVRVIQSWLGSKKKVFAAPWDRTAINQFTTGPLHRDITQPGGSVDWLKKYGGYYDYRSFKVSNIGELSTKGQYPSITVEVQEDRTLMMPNGPDPSKSGQTTTTVTYLFALEDGIWKIHDYQEVQ